MRHVASVGRPWCQRSPNSGVALIGTGPGGLVRREPSAGGDGCSAVPSPARGRRASDHASGGGLQGCPAGASARDCRRCGCRARTARRSRPVGWVCEPPPRARQVILEKPDLRLCAAVDDGPDAPSSREHGAAVYALRERGRRDDVGAGAHPGPRPGRAKTKPTNNHFVIAYASSSVHRVRRAGLSLSSSTAR